MGDSERHFESASLTQQELHARLGWLIGLRWVAVVGLLVGVLNTRLVVGPHLAYGSLLVFTGLLALINVSFMAIDRLLRRSGRIERGKNVLFAMLQIVVDLVMITLAVHGTGGVHSVLVICYTFHMVLASELLVRWLAYLTALLASVLLDGVVLLAARGVIVQHALEGFTLGYGGGEPLDARATVHICMLYNALFFGMVYIASSISGRLREREEEVERVNRELRRVNEAKSAFMRMASHELRTPLAAVEGLQGMIWRQLRRERQCDPECDDLLVRSTNRIKAMRNLVGDLLAYSRLQALDEREEYARLDLADLVRYAVEELEPVADPAGVVFHCDLKRCDIEGVEDQLRILADNLLSNAVRYSYPGGTVEVRVEPEGSQALFEVTDHGIGIEPEALEEVFDEFFRAPSAKEYEPAGTGMGLTLCRRIVERHGGRIAVDSEPDVRTVFSVRLPGRIPTQ